MDIKLLNSDQHVAKIKVIGVGGCGGNLVSYMSQRPTSGVQFVAVNTDSQALANMGECVRCIQIGTSSTKGLGAGSKPEVAREAALAEADNLREVIDGMDMVFVVAGMGKGTGTGASPVIAQMARDLGVLTVALVVMPFEFENRKQPAEEGLMALSNQCDSLIVAPNEKLKEALGEQVGMREAYVAAHDVLYNAVCGISDIINKHGEINVDFNDVRTAMTGKGKAVIGSASAKGEERASKATEAALRSELMESVDLAGASHILLNISGGNIRMDEVCGVVEVVRENATDLRGTITPGMALDDEMGEELRVTVIITGVREYYQPKISALPEDKKSQLNDFFESGRRQHNITKQTELNGGKSHRTPAVLRKQTN